MYEGYPCCICVFFKLQHNKKKYRDLLSFCAVMYKTRDLMDFSHWKIFKQWLKERKKNRGRSSAFHNDSNPNWGKCGIWKWFSLFIGVKMHWFTTYVVDIVSIFFFFFFPLRASWHRLRFHPLNSKGIR